MADKKLNEVTKVTDMAYVPVIMADGSIGQIAKADLASVVAGQMGNPIGYAGAATVNNIDSKTNNGFYAIRDTGNSINGWTAYGTLIVLNTEQTSFVNQIFIHAQGLLAFRVKTGSDWSNWITVSLK